MMFSTVTQSLIQVYNTFANPVAARSKAWVCGWECGFEFHRGHGCPSLVSVVCCQIEIFAISSLV